MVAIPLSLGHGRLGHHLLVISDDTTLGNPKPDNESRDNNDGN